MATHSNTAIVCLAGILARCEEQHRPLWLERFGKVVYIDYFPYKFDASETIDDAVEAIAELHQAGYDVTLLGSSLGANVGAFVGMRLKADYRDVNDWFNFIAVDGPAGSRTFTATQSLPPGLITSWLGSVIFAVLGWFILFIGRMGPGLPKDEYITRPDDGVVDYLTGRANFSDQEWNDWVKQEAKRCLTGHRARVWAQQLQWMTRIGEDGSLDVAVCSLAGMNVTYVQCTEGNDVVVQPKAQRWWLDRIGTTRSTGVPSYRTVEAPHCGYLQMQSAFELKIVPLVV